MKILDQNEDTNDDFTRVLYSGKLIETIFYNRQIKVEKVTDNQKCMCDSKALFKIIERDGDNWLWCGKCGDGGG